VLALASLVAFWIAARESDSKLKGAVMRRRCTVTVLTGAFAPAVIVSGFRGWYGWQLSIAGFVVLFLVAISVVAPTLRVRSDRKKYWGRLAAEEAAADQAGTGQPAGTGAVQPLPDTP
jgi:hypothetical protein